MKAHARESPTKVEKFGAKQAKLADTTRKFRCSVAKTTELEVSPRANVPDGRKNQRPRLFRARPLKLGNLNGARLPADSFVLQHAKARRPLATDASFTYKLKSRQANLKCRAPVIISNSALSPK